MWDQGRSLGSRRCPLDPNSITWVILVTRGPKFKKFSKLYPRKRSLSCPLPFSPFPWRQPIPPDGWFFQHFTFRQALHTRMHTCTHMYTRAHTFSPSPPFLLYDLQQVKQSADELCLFHLTASLGCILHSHVDSRSIPFHSYTVFLIKIKCDHFNSPYPGTGRFFGPFALLLLRLRLPCGVLLWG